MSVKLAPADEDDDDDDEATDDADAAVECELWMDECEEDAWDADTRPRTPRTPLLPPAAPLEGALAPPATATAVWWAECTKLGSHIFKKWHTTYNFIYSMKSDRIFSDFGYQNVSLSLTG